MTLVEMLRTQIRHAGTRSEIVAGTGADGDNRHADRWGWGDECVPVRLSATYSTNISNRLTVVNV